MKRETMKSRLAMLPNMLTLMNLFTGFLSIFLASQGKPVAAASLLPISLIWDSLDGNVARIFKNTSQLGRELDSLADIVSFIVAPALIMVVFQIDRLNITYLLVVFLYLGCGAYRLARFNIRPSIKYYFEGLPTPAAAMTLIMTCLAYQRNDWFGHTFALIILFCFTAVLSILMVSEVHYPKLSAIQFTRWRSLFYVAIILLIVKAVLINLETALASVCLVFVFLAPAYCLSLQTEKDPLAPNVQKRKQ